MLTDDKGILAVVWAACHSKLATALTITSAPYHSPAYLTCTNESTIPDA